MNVELPFSAAAERNAEPIATKLAELSTEKSLDVLEIGSGTGQHVAFFADRFSGWTFHPSDRNSDYFDAIRHRAAKRPNIREPIVVDLLHSQSWPNTEKFGLILAINVFQVAPKEVIGGLYQLARQVLEPGGKIITYSPLTHQGRYTSEGDAAFDQRLRERDPQLGIRSLESLKQAAMESNFELRQEIPMPANNWLTLAS
jgi:cyclopropane fatty-acyl-phospholipid synthase-like methyltransferase